jgi:hypothetical protein
LNVGELVKYKSRVLLVLGISKDKDYRNWVRAIEVGTSSVRIYHPDQLIKL